MRRWLLVLAVAACHRHHAVDELVIDVDVPGVSATELETTVAMPLEREVQKLYGIAHVHTSIEPGRVVVLAELDREDSDLKIRAAVYEATSHAELPPNVMADLDTQLHGHRAFLRYVVTDTAEFALQASLRTIPGLAADYDCGIPESVHKIELLPAHLAARGLTATDVLGELDVATLAADLTSDVMLGKTTPNPVRLGDIAIVTDATRRDCTALEDGHPVAVGAVILRPTHDDDDDTRRERATALLRIAKARVADDAVELAVEPAGAQPVQLAAVAQALQGIHGAIVEQGLREPWRPQLSISAWVPPSAVAAATTALQRAGLVAFRADADGTLVCALDRDKLAKQAVARAGMVRIGAETAVTTQLDVDDDRAAAAGVTRQEVIDAAILSSPDGSMLSAGAFHRGRGSIVHVDGDPRIGGVPLSALLKRTTVAQPSLLLREDGRPCVRFVPAAR